MHNCPTPTAVVEGDPLLITVPLGVHRNTLTMSQQTSVRACPGKSRIYRRVDSGFAD